MSVLAGLKICFVAGTIGRGGAERQLSYAITTLDSHGASVRVLSLTRGEYWERQLKDRIPIEWVGSSGNRAVRLAHVSAAVNRHRPDVVQSVHFFTNLYAVAAARLRGAREIGAIRSNVTSEIRGSGTFLGRMSLKLPRNIAVNSRAALERAEALGVPSRRLHLLPNVIDTEYFSPVEVAADRELTIVAVGRCGPEKRFDRFLSILRGLSLKHRPGVKGILVGTGPLMPQLERRAVELELRPEILDFRGTVDDMASAYRQADVLVLTSDFEGTPNVVLEAMACGLPVVATKVGGVPGLVIHGETGYLFPPEDEDQAVGFLMDLAVDAKARRAMGRRARQCVVNKHSLEQLPGFLESLYRRVLS